MCRRRSSKRGTMSRPQWPDSNHSPSDAPGTIQCTRWERHLENYLGMVQLACARILLRAFMS